jgi:hypothetical protein
MELQRTLKIKETERIESSFEGIGYLVSVGSQLVSK